MRDSDSILSLKELETLCHLYLDCRLTTLEEKELEYILLNPALQNPASGISIVQDVKRIMEFEDREYLKLNRSVKTLKGRNLVSFKLWGAAAAVIILILSSMLFFNVNDRGYINHTNNIDYTRQTAGKVFCEVYSNGRQLNQEEALEIANDNLKRMKAFEEKIQLIENEEKEKVEKFKTITKGMP